MNNETIAPQIQVHEQRRKSMIRMVDLVLLTGTFIVFLLVVGYARPLVTGPLQDNETTSTGSHILFEILPSQSIVISPYGNFSDSVEYPVQDGQRIHLSAGEYHFKSIGDNGGEIHILQVVNDVDLGIQITQGHYSVVNVGSNELEIKPINEKNGAASTHE